MGQRRTNTRKLDVGPLRAQRSMTEELAERIANRILSGELQSSSRLPTVQEMALRFGVSRTVIRETITLLKADGLIIVRHGSGMFVAGDPRRRPLRIDPDDVTGVREIIAIVQVRLGLEVEAAGLAAATRTSSQLRRIASAFRGMQEATKKKMLAVDEDRLFHTEIAAATGNEYFVRILEFLGRYIIPHSKIRIGRGTDEERVSYLAKVQEEHRAIFEAIGAREPERAREAMRRHLTLALERLVNLEPDEMKDAKRLIEQRSTSVA
jgi:DNA-binding FadR family transcriptional regulator